MNEHIWKMLQGALDEGWGLELHKLAVGVWWIKLFRMHPTTRLVQQVFGRDADLHTAVVDVRTKSLGARVVDGKNVSLLTDDAGPATREIE